MTRPLAAAAAMTLAISGAATAEVKIADIRELSGAGASPGAV